MAKGISMQQIIFLNASVTRVALQDSSKNAFTLVFVVGVFTDEITLSRALTHLEFRHLLVN